MRYLCFSTQLYLIVNALNLIFNSGGIISMPGEQVGGMEVTGEGFRGEFSL